MMKYRIVVGSLDGSAKAEQLGSFGNPIQLNISDLRRAQYPTEHANRPYIYVIPKDGKLTKWYRSYADYCFD
jgi:hypothetical protein